MRYRAILTGLAVLTAAALALPAAPARATSGGAVVGGGSSGSPGAAGARPSRGAASESGGAAAGGAYKPRHRLVATAFALSDTRITAGHALPSVTVLLTQPDVPKVVAYIQVTPPTGRATRVDLGTITTGRKHTFALPKGRLPALAKPGTYALRLSAVTAQGQTVTRTTRSPGRASLTVGAPAAPVVGDGGGGGGGDDDTGEITPVPGNATSVAAPAPSSSTTAVRFPVAGPHGFGGAGSRFGVGRVGHTHQGQDVPADEGTPVVAPTAGEVTSIGYQAAAAGEWVAMHSVDGRDFFFAHCVRRSTAVAEGQTVKAGTHLCDVGATGDADGPHLHFEIWVDGWRTSRTSHPIDPLPQLEAWQSADPRW